jgi:hypothetical protein
MSLKKSDFRVVEKHGNFYIEKKRTYRQLKELRFFRKDEYEYITEWRLIIPTVFTSLSDAEKAIEAIIEEPKYHYFE